MKRMALAMGFVAKAILEFELHNLNGILQWHMVQMGLGRLENEGRLSKSDSRSVCYLS